MDAPARNSARNGARNSARNSQPSSDKFCQRVMLPRARGMKHATLALLLHEPDIGGARKTFVPFCPWLLSRFSSLVLLSRLTLSPFRVFPSCRGRPVSRVCVRAWDAERTEPSA